MAFTEATLVAQLDAAATGRTITLQPYQPGPTITTVYAVGVTAPYAGRSRFVDLTSSNSAAQVATQLQNALTACSRDSRILSRGIPGIPGFFPAGFPGKKSR